MTDCSVFIDKAIPPTEESLKTALGEKYILWRNLRSHVEEKLGKPGGGWHYSGVKFGWSYRIKEKDQNVIYLLPRKLAFKAAMVFGEKAVERILASDIGTQVKDSLKAAVRYAEGRGIKLQVDDESSFNDVLTLVTIKQEGRR